MIVAGRTISISLIVNTAQTASEACPVDTRVRPLTFALIATPTNADNHIAHCRANLEEAESLNPQLTNCASLGCVSARKQCAAVMRSASDC
jgi:hypothetical protein